MPAQPVNPGAPQLHLTPPHPTALIGSLQTALAATFDGLPKPPGAYEIGRRWSPLVRPAGAPDGSRWTLQATVEIRYQTTSPLAYADVLAFFERELPAAGWYVAPANLAGKGVSREITRAGFRGYIVPGTYVGMLPLTPGPGDFGVIGIAAPVSVTPEAPYATPLPVGRTPVTTTMETVRVEPPSQSVAVGETFSATVVLDTGSLFSRGVQFGLRFDPTVVQLTHVEEGDFYQTWARAHGGQTTVTPLPTTDDDAGTVSVLGLAILGGPADEGPVGRGVIYTLTGRVIREGTATLALHDVLVANPDDRGFAPTVVNATVTGVPLGAGSATPTGARSSPLASVNSG
jgi:hypothetical protein